MSKAWTRSKVLSAIGLDGKIDAAVVEKAVYTVWLGQTTDEKAVGDVRHLNRRGFGTKTRYWGTKLARHIETALNRVGGDKSRVPWGKIFYTTIYQNHAIEVARHHAAQVAQVWNQMNAEAKAKAA